MLSAKQKAFIEGTVFCAAQRGGIEQPTVIYFTNGTVAGRAHYNTNLVAINEIIARDNFNQELVETILHEVGHLVTRLRHGKVKPHGTEWRSVVTELGGNPRTTHTMDTSNTKRRKYFMYEYKCKCRTHQLTSIKHNRVVKNTRQYTCNTCKTRLEYVRDLGK